MVKLWDTLYRSLVGWRDGGNLNGFFLVKGKAHALNSLRNTEEFMELTTRCNFCLEGFGVVNGWTGDGVDTIMKQYKKNI